MQDFVDRCEAADYADLARLAHFSQPRIAQIVNPFLLAPDIQEAILSLVESPKPLRLPESLRPITPASRAHNGRWRRSRRSLAIVPDHPRPAPRHVGNAPLRMGRDLRLARKCLSRHTYDHGVIP